MKIGLCITTFNRPAYLRQTLETISLADLDGVQIVIVDDCSTDLETIKQIYAFPAVKLTPEKNSSIRNTLRMGLDYLFQNGCDIAINLDSDVLVRKDFIRVLVNLHKRFPCHLITGFNSLGKTLKGTFRHPVIESGEGYNTKASIGGINLLLTKETYNQFVRPALLSTAKAGGQWDKEASLLSEKAGKPIYCAVPSVVQHIGFTSSMGHHDNPDVAEDFVNDNKKKLCVLQPFGIGDIIFCQTLVKQLGDYEIIWPVRPHFVEDLNRAYPDVKFIPDTETPVSLDIKHDRFIDGYRSIPIRWSDTIRSVPYRLVMRAKYDMYRQDFRKWKDKAMWDRNRVKEDELFQLLGLEGKKYTVVNNTFGCEFQHKASIRTTDGSIQMRKIEGYSLFDWAKVLENADEIHTVSTSLLFILDLLKTKNVHVYIRQPMERSHRNYDYLFTDKKFIYR